MARSDTQFKPGHPGGPGRPKGARNKLSSAFIQTLSDDFEEHGIEVVQQVRIEQPAKYLDVVGRLMPRLMELSGPDGDEIPTSLELKVVKARKED